MIKKLSHIWYYYKWYILAALGLLLVVLSFLSQKKEQVTPDGTVSFVTGSLITQAELDRLSLALSQYFEDSNSDGQVYVRVNVYGYDAQAMSAKDPNAFVASAVQLAAELRLREAAMYFTDQRELLEEQTELVSCGKWGDYSALAAISEEYSEFDIMAFEDMLECVNKLK